jgi:hypothetical protein
MEHSTGETTAHDAGSSSRAPAAGPVAAGAPAATLTPDPRDAPAPIALAEAERAAAVARAVGTTGGHGHGGHGASGTYSHLDAGRAGQPPPPGAAADDSVAPAARDYVCPLHPTVREAAPGTCPICGGTLERREEQ